MILRLERFCYAPYSTLGRFYLPSGEFVFTVERPWRFNVIRESCIPEGTFDCVPYSSEKYPDTWEILVPGRTKILFHAANRASELMGCIAPGMTLSDTEFKVISSRTAMGKLKEDLPERFQLAVYQYRADYENK